MSLDLFCLLLMEESVRMKVWSRSLLPFCPNQGSWAFWHHSAHPRRCRRSWSRFFWRGGSCSGPFWWDGRCSRCSWRDGRIRSRTRRSWGLEGLHPVHDRLVGCDGGSVSPSVGSAGFCAGASLQSADRGGGGRRGYSWGRPVHQVVFHLQIKTTVRKGCRTTLVVTCCSFLAVVLFPSFSFLFSFSSALAGAALNSFFATLAFSFFGSSLCFLGGVGK